ncbi:DinB family protein [Acidobacteriota bacterium]
MEKSTISRRRFVGNAALGAGVLALSSTSRLFAQEGATLAPVVKNVWKTGKAYLMEFAKAMPDDKYGFKPTEEVFSFSEQILHLAGTNYWCFSNLKGEKNPMSEEALKAEGKSKADVIKILEESFAYGDGYVEALTEAKATGEAPMGRNKMPVWKVVLFCAEHITHHRGQTVVYLRLNGITPPRYQTGYFG